MRQQAIRRLRDDEPGASEDFRLHVVAHDGARHILACHPHDGFDVPGLSGLVLHARDVTAEFDDASRHAAAEATRDRFRARLATLGESKPGTSGPDQPEPGESRPGNPDRVMSLLEAACIDLDATIAVWSVSFDDGPPRAVARYPLHGDAGFVDAVARSGLERLVVDDSAALPSTVDRRGGSIAAFVDLPLRLDARTVGLLTVGTARRRAWTSIELDHVASLAALTALAWVDSSDTPRATIDPLTSLIGRGEAERRLAERIAERAVHPALLVLVVDVDRLRDINDRHGHETGDRVIAGVAARLRAHVGEAGFVARVGGDEFLLVLDEIDNSKTEPWIQMVLDDLAGVAAAEMPRVEASIGAARLAIDSPDARSLWHKADLAMREAKERGRGQAVFFDPRMAAAIAARTALGAEIEGALERDEFALFYQPQISLSSGKLVGLEALLRWQHPVRGLLLPHLFIDAAIDRGLIDAITKVAFGQVCDQIVRWQRLDGFPDVPVSVNVSARQFHDRRLPALVASALLRTGLPARLLILELSEQNLVVDSAATERVVKELSLLGVRIAIGSFGLNPTSLRLLHQLRVSQIKLDRGLRRKAAPGS